MSEHSHTHQNQPRTPKDKNVYGGNYPKAKIVAMKRSSGTCQFCGLRRAKDAHHWAWPDYPSGDKVDQSDLTALCKPCHRLVTIIRNWAEKQGNADFNALAGELENANSFYEERKALSAWLFPEIEESPEDKSSKSSIQNSNDSPRNTQVERYVLIAEDYAPPKTACSPNKTQAPQPNTPENTTKSTTWIWVFLLIITITIFLTRMYLDLPWPTWLFPIA